jgi:predicted Zn-dependent peptidase
LIGRVLRPLLFHRLRDVEKGAYSVVANGGFAGMCARPFLSVEFEALPQDVDRLTFAVLDELKNVANGDVDDVVFNNAKMELRSVVLRDLVSPTYLMDYLCDQLHQETMSTDGLRREEILNKLTKQDLIELVSHSINISHCTLFELL